MVGGHIALLPLALVTAAIAGNPLSPDTLVLHESRTILPGDFSLVSPAPADQAIPLRFALVQKDPDGLIDALNAVSDPSNPRYGQHLSKEEVDEFVAPRPESLSAVTSWLAANGLSATTLSPAGDWLGITIPVEQANSLLGASFSTFKHGPTGVEAIRTLEYSLPADVKQHIDLVFPTTSFAEPISAIEQPKHASSIHKPRSAFSHRHIARAAVSPCANGTTPACLQKLYGIPLAPATNRSRRLGVTGRYGNRAHYSFLETFLRKFRPDMNPKTNFTLDIIDGGDNDQDAPSVSEGELDMQYTVGLATNVPVEYIMVGFKNSDGALEGYLDEINHLLAQKTPPAVLTTSYGFREESLSFALADKLCKAYAQLGARGVSVLFASGDSGAGCPSTGDPSQPNARPPVRFAPVFPSTCPYVTSVGGTAGFAPEHAWEGSSGGFSAYFPAPPYQAAAVSAYVSALSPTSRPHRPPAAFNASGRAFPDVAAKADAFQVVLGARVAPVFGTSAAAPTLASIVALINDRLAGAHRPPLGFLNPWLYGKAQGAGGWTDVTEGNNRIDCAGDGKRIAGWEASEGWDPVTGLGTPRFDRLLKAAGL